jgi:DNA-binding transcriptional regulator GbsR (MarR family)
MPQAVSDFLSNTNEQIEQAARAIGRSIITRKVFSAIYTGKKRIKTVSELAKSTKLKRKTVLTAGKKLHSRSVVQQTKRDGDTAYEKIDSFYAHKSKILQLAGNNKKLEAFPTKRHVTTKIWGAMKSAVKLAKTEQITIDDIDSFNRVRLVKADSHLPNGISEKKFKHGVRRILKEPGKFTDWGGERNDLYSTRVRIAGKRHAAAFAFKGPGQQGKLVPGKMGKNGDQIQRLFQSVAEVFFVQYWREIDESVIEQMNALAIAKSLSTGKKILFGIIDGVDSHRLFKAYPAAFK